MFIFLKRRVFSGLYFRYNISDVLFWLFVFSVSISVIIIYENSNTELQERKTHAEKLSTQADPSSERLISIALTYIDDDFLIENFQRFAIPSSNAYLKDSLINKNFSAYINKFDTRIYTFDAEEKPLHNIYTGQSFSYDALNTIFRIKGHPSSVNNLRYFEEADKDDGSVYLRPEVKLPVLLQETPFKPGLYYKRDYPEQRYKNEEACKYPREQCDRLNQVVVFLCKYNHGIIILPIP